MPRSSRHKSHRPHKHSSREDRDLSEAEEERSSREGRPTAEEPEASLKVRVSRNPEPEKRKFSAKEAVGSGEGDSGEHRRKRKERPENSERWHEGDEDYRREEFGPSEMEKVGKVKAISADSVDKYSKKREGSVDRNEESAGKRRTEKESSRKDSSGQKKDVKERDREHRSGEDSSRRESGSNLYKDSMERDRDRRNEEDSGRLDGHFVDSKDREKGRRTEESHRRASGSESHRRASGSEYKDSKDRDKARRSDRDDKKAQEGSDGIATRKEDGFKDDRKNHDNYDSQLEIEIRSPDLNKEMEKHSRRRDSSGDKDKRQGDSRDNEDRRVSSRDDRSKNGSYRDDKHKDTRYREKTRDDHDRDRRYHDEKYRDEHYSRDHDRSESKYYREENKFESRHKRSKPHDGDPDGSSYIDEHGTKYKDSRERKRFSDEKLEECSDLKHRNQKELRGFREKTSSGAEKFESNSDGLKLDNSRLGRADSSFSNAPPKGSSPSSHGYMEQNRYSLKHEESLHKQSPSGERLHSNSARSSEKLKAKDGTSARNLLVESSSSSRHNRTPRSDSHASPNKLMERSPTVKERKVGPIHGLEVEEMAQKVGFGSKEARDHLAFDDRERDASEKQSSDAYTRTDMHNRMDSHFSSHLPLSHPFRGIDGPTFLGSYEDDSRNKSAGRFRRSGGGGGDAGTGRGQATGAWRGPPTWSSTVANGFLPLPHGPQPGFHPPPPQFSTLPVFGVRPPIDLNHVGLPYNIHEAAERYAGLVRPYGWRGPVDDSCLPLLQVRDTNNGMFGEESHPFGRLDWDHNRNMMGSSRGWERTSEQWKGSNGNPKSDYSGPLKESEYQPRPSADGGWAGQTGNQLHSERPPPEGVGGKQPKDFPPDSKDVFETPSKSTSDSAKSPRTLRVSKEPQIDPIRAFSSYLSKLDVSVDLTSPDLYEQCVSFRDPRDAQKNEVSEGFESQGNKIQNLRKVVLLNCNKEEAQVGTTKEIINNLLPKAANTLFEKAISLYKKRAGGSKAASTVTVPFSSLVQGGGGLDLSEGIVYADTKPDNLDLDSIGTDPVPDLSVEPEERAAEWETDHVPDSAVGETAAQYSDPGEGLVVDECRVNFNRIHLSPGSTH